MSSIINATTTAGVTVTGDNSGSLQLATNNGTTAVTIDTSQRAAFVAGTAALPAITTTGDTNTGIFFPAADTIAFAEGGTEVMRIDSSGFVTTPNQPAFMAYRTNGAVSGTGVFICNTTTFNDGSHFNTTTGKFTAPVAGRYQCNFFVLCQNPNNIDINIYVNNAMYASMDIRCNSNAVNSNFTLSVSGVLKLSANDTVNPQITSQPSGSVYGSGLNGFSMCLLG